MYTFAFVSVKAYVVMKFNEILKEENKVLNHEGSKAFRMTPEMELYTAAVTSALSGKFYESPKEFVGRISALVGQVDPPSDSTCCSCFYCGVAQRSACRAHNPEAAGSNPAPATKRLP